MLIIVHNISFFVVRCGLILVTHNIWGKLTSVEAIIRLPSAIFTLATLGKLTLATTKMAARGKRWKTKAPFKSD